MKKVFITLSLIVVVVLPGFAQQTIELSKWKFATGDNPEWAKPGYNDNDWDRIKPGSSWEQQGYARYNGYAWYRIKFLLPVSMKKHAFTDSLHIVLGKIDDHNQAFLNGKLLGQNAKTIPAADHTPVEELSKTPMAWNVECDYAIPFNDPRLLWNQDNVIAVRVYDEIYDGGLYSLPVQVVVKSFKDFLVLDTRSTSLEARPDGTKSKTIILKSSASFAVKGKLTTEITEEETGKVIATQSQDVVLKKGETPVTLSFKSKLPQNIKTVYTFTEQKTGEKLSKTVWSFYARETAMELDDETMKLYSPKTGLVYADCPYRYALSGNIEGRVSFKESGLHQKNITTNGNEIIVRGEFPSAKLEMKHVFRQFDDRMEETIILKNLNTDIVNLDDIRFGFVANLNTRPDWRLCAVPFRIQLDGSKHDYTTEELIKGQYSNTIFKYDAIRQPPLTEEGRLRSEAWLWWNGQKGLSVIKYNNDAVELSVAFPHATQEKATLQFGGVGFCLYGEPSPARHLASGQEITFGKTIYKPFEGSIAEGFANYREYLDQKGHTFPKDYNPPINWDELYDIGWHHSDSAKLNTYYTRKALLEEARKAKAVGCDLLYLDPGWEVAEGTTIWDSTRLGSVSSLIRTLKDEYGLDLGYRTILHCHKKNYWPRKFQVKHADYEPFPKNDGEVYEQPLCLSNPEFAKIKLDRILKISKQGIRFMMFDEMVYIGTCVDTAHHHPVPLTPLDHIKAVHALSKEVRQQCPGLTIECHDPVWPWWNSIYAPVYFQQGFGDKGCYDENWGFEYMWDCINDLKSGKALSLYYYNLGCNVPLYLMITMAADNENCLFFWWAASTIRHLGIGGKYGLGGAPAGYDPEKRFAAYQKQMRIYKQLKPYFVRGEFHGLAENIHLHTLPDTTGGVITAFNLKNEPQQLTFLVPSELLGGNKQLEVKGADAKWTEKGVELKLTLPAMSPAVVCIGESTKK